LEIQNHLLEILGSRAPAAILALHYGAIVWYGKSRQSTVTKKLSSIQRQACLLITGAFKTTPTSALEFLLNLPPLQLLLKREARMASYRLCPAHISDVK